MDLSVLTTSAPIEFALCRISAGSTWRPVRFGNEFTVTPSPAPRCLKVKVMHKRTRRYIYQVTKKSTQPDRE